MGRAPQTTNNPPTPLPGKLHFLHSAWVKEEQDLPAGLIDMASCSYRGGGGGGHILYLSVVPGTQVVLPGSFQGVSHQMNLVGFYGSSICAQTTPTRPPAAGLPEQCSWIPLGPIEVQQQSAHNHRKPSSHPTRLGMSKSFLQMPALLTIWHHKHTCSSPRT